MQSVKDVPPANVGSVVQDFIDFDGAKEVESVEQSNGNFTVTMVR